MSNRVVAAVADTTVDTRSIPSAEIWFAGGRAGLEDLKPVITQAGASSMNKRPDRYRNAVVAPRHGCRRYGRPADYGYVLRCQLVLRARSVRTHLGVLVMDRRPRRGGGRAAWCRAVGRVVRANCTGRGAD